MPEAVLWTLALLLVLSGIAGAVLPVIPGGAPGECAARRGLRQAGRVGVGTWLGIVLGSAAKVGLTVAMVGVFAVAWFV